MPLDNYHTMPTGGGMTGVPCLAGSNARLLLSCQVPCSLRTYETVWMHIICNQRSGAVYKATQQAGTGKDGE